MSQISSPTGFSAVDHGPKHLGFDIGVTPGDKVISIISGRVRAEIKDELTDTDLAGLIIDGMGEDKGISIRLIGLKSDLKVDQQINHGQNIGIATGANKSFKSVTPYIHLEIYIQNKRVNSIKLVKMRWPKKSIVNAGEKYIDKQWNVLKQLDSGIFDSFESKKNIYKRSLSTPVWESFGFEPYHRYADFLAKNKKFKEAVAIQEILVSFLEMELTCAQNKMPSVRFGTIAACRSAISVPILLSKMKENLSQYQSKKQSLFNY